MLWDAVCDGRCLCVCRICRFVTYVSVDVCVVGVFKVCRYICVVCVPGRYCVWVAVCLCDMSVVWVTCLCGCVRGTCRAGNVLPVIGGDQAWISCLTLLCGSGCP